MTKNELLIEIKKLENSLEKSYRSLRTEKYIRSNEAFQLMKEVFTETYSGYKTRAKSKLKKDELLNYYEQLKHIRSLRSSTVKGWREQKSQWRKEAKEKGIDTYAIEKKYDNWIDFIDSKPWQESAGEYYDSEELNRISWLEESEQYGELMKWCLIVEEDKKELFESQHYTKISTILTPANTEDVLNEIWRSGSF